MDYISTLQTINYIIFLIYNMIDKNCSKRTKEYEEELRRYVAEMEIAILESKIKKYIKIINNKIKKNNYYIEQFYINNA
jgi:hypothetical protein